MTYTDPAAAANAKASLSMRAGASTRALSEASCSKMSRESGQPVSPSATSPLEYAKSAVDSLCEPDQWVLAATAKALLVGYDANWRHTHEEMVLHHVEAELVAPLAAVDPPLESESWQIGGRLDKIVSDEHGVCLYDHKTTSQAIDDPNGLFWRGLQIDSQHQHYELLAWLNGIKFDRIVWDVVRKPTIRPRRLAKAEKAALASSGNWHGVVLGGDEIAQAIHECRETVELFSARATAEVLSNPARYFARRTVVRSRPELAEYADELFQVGQSMERARRLNRHYRNASACLQYGTPCEYLDICSGHDREDSDNWRRTSEIHRELETVEEGGDLITHSRLRCFLTCRRKHYYRYELGLDPTEAQQREALFFGRLWHTALDAYWQASCRSGSETNSNDQDTSPKQAPRQLES